MKLLFYFISAVFITAYSTSAQEEPDVIKFTLSARNLPLFTDPYGLGITDSYARVYNDNMTLGWTEVILEAANPDWVRVFEVNFTGENEQELRVEVWDSDFWADGDDFLGSINLNVGDLLSEETIGGDLLNGTFARTGQLYATRANETLKF